jgi:two-component system, cell cycle response regulator
VSTETLYQTNQQLEQKPTRMNAPSVDSRPTFRIASFGMAYKFQRLLEIVLRHARHNPYRFEIAGSRAPEDYDIAIVDMTVKGGPEVATTLRRSIDGRPVLRMGRRNDTARGTDDLLVDQFTIQLLRSLNRAAEGMKALKLKGFFNPPNAPRSTTAIAAPENAVALPVSLRPAKIRALVIDDSQTVRRQLSLALHQMGIETEGVNGAQEALDVLSVRRYDLIFCDVMMPGGANGFELTKAIKRDRALKEAPLIILTSKSSPFDLLRGALAGCNSYLVKPVSLKALRETVVKNLRRSSRFDIHLEPSRRLA